jgi:hypothetical protein
MSQHVRYNALKLELNKVLSATFVDEIKKRVHDRAEPLYDARKAEMVEEVQATQQAEKALWEEASNNSCSIERWARKAADLLQADEQTEQDRAYVAMLLRNLRDRSGL